MAVALNRPLARKKLTLIRAKLVDEWAEKIGDRLQAIGIFIFINFIGVARVTAVGRHIDHHIQGLDDFMRRVMVEKVFFSHFFF